MKRIHQPPGWEEQSSGEAEILLTVRYCRVHGWEPETSDYPGGPFDVREITGIDMDGREVDRPTLEKLRPLVQARINSLEFKEDEPEEQDHERI